MFFSQFHYNWYARVPSSPFITELFFPLELILSKNVTNISLILVRSSTELSKLNKKEMYFDKIVLRCEKTHMLSKGWTWDWWRQVSLKKNGFFYTSPLGGLSRSTFLTLGEVSLLDDFYFYHNRHDHWNGSIIDNIPVLAMYSGSEGVRLCKAWEASSRMFLTRKKDKLKRG